MKIKKQKRKLKSRYKKYVAGGMYADNTVSAAGQGMPGSTANIVFDQSNPKILTENLNYLELVYYGEENRAGIKYSNQNRHTERNTDRQIKICPECNITYEIYSKGQGKYDQYNYQDFPRYGKGREK